MNRIIAWIGVFLFAYGLTYVCFHAYKLKVIIARLEKWKMEYEDPAHINMIDDRLEIAQGILGQYFLTYIVISVSLGLLVLFWPIITVQKKQT